MYFLGEGEIVENAFRVRPLAEEVIVLEKVVMPECGVGHDQRLHRHRVLFHQVRDTRAGIDDDLISKARMAAAIHRFLARKDLAEAPMIIHQRHGERGIGVEHLLGRNDLDLVGIGVELQIVMRDLLDRLEGAVKRGEVPFGFGEKKFTHAVSAFLNSSRKTGKISAGLEMRLVAKLDHSSATVR